MPMNTQVVTSMMPDHYRELCSMVESGLAKTVEAAGPLPPPSRGRVSRRVKSFPIAPRVDLQPDEKAQRWLLSISASDRVGLLYSVARVLARHKLNLQLAKVYYAQENLDQAATHLMNARDIDPNDVDVWVALGHYFLDVKNPSEAKKAFEAGLRLDPTNIKLQTYVNNLQ